MKAKDPRGRNALFRSVRASVAMAATPPVALPKLKKTGKTLRATKTTFSLQKLLKEANVVVPPFADPSLGSSGPTPTSYVLHPLFPIESATNLASRGFHVADCGPLSVDFLTLW